MSVTAGTVKNRVATLVSSVYVSPILDQQPNDFRIAVACGMVDRVVAAAKEPRRGVAPGRYSLNSRTKTHALSDAAL